MDKQLEGRIRALAQPLWESAARPYGVALDYWLMAEQMVLEMMAATARLGASAVSEPPPIEEESLPTAMPVHRIRDLAYCMWESAGSQYGMAWDFWLAAEKHVLAVLRAASEAAGAVHGEDAPMPKELISLSPGEYLHRIRLAAYREWEAAGRQYGRALDFWLNAEQELLAMMAAAARRAAPTVEDAAQGMVSPEPVGTASVPPAEKEREASGTAGAQAANTEAGKEHPVSTAAEPPPASPPANRERKASKRKSATASPRAQAS